MLQHVIFASEMNLKYAQMLLKDISQDQMTAQPAAGKAMNHPAWVLGHLAYCNDFTLSLFGRQASIPQDWKSLFGGKTTPQADGKVYPGKATLQGKYEETARAIIELVKARPEHLATPMPEHFAPRFPAVGDFVIFHLTTHTGTHLGQLSAWRRAMGLPSVM